MLFDMAQPCTPTSNSLRTSNLMHAISKNYGTENVRSIWKITYKHKLKRNYTKQDFNKLKFDSIGVKNTIAVGVDTVKQQWWDSIT